MKSAPGNPYRRPKPSRADRVFRGKFYPADERGQSGLHAKPLTFVLGRAYLYVSELLSIPLVTISETGLTRHGGFIQYHDSIENTEVRLFFTKIGFLRYKPKKVEAFLALVDAYRRQASEDWESENAERLDTEQLMGCEQCDAQDVHILSFEVLRFVGMIPIAYSYSLTPKRYVLCAAHARRQAIRSCLSTAFLGSLGFPGFLAAPWYVTKNVWALKRCGIADTGTVLFCVMVCILLPLSVFVGLIVWLLSALD